jgi:hypothetical protein
MRISQRQSRKLPKLVEPIHAGELDVAFGSRALDRRLIGTRQSWAREQGGRVFNLLVRVSTGLPFWDTQCGFKAFRLGGVPARARESA